MQAAGIAAKSVTTNSSFTTTLYHYCPVHYLTRISILDSRPPAIVLPTASDGPGRGQLWLLRVQRNPEVLHFKRFLMHLSVPLLPSAFLATRRRPLSARRRQLRRSAEPCFQTVAASDGPPPGAANNSEHV